jgi:hypothetical protein
LLLEDVPELIDGKRYRVVLEGVINDIRIAPNAFSISGDRVNGNWITGGNNHIVSIERLPDPEPEWKSGNVVVDALNVMYVRVPPYGDGPWVWLRRGQPYSGVADTLLKRPLKKIWPVDD